MSEQTKADLSKIIQSLSDEELKSLQKTKNLTEVLSPRFVELMKQNGQSLLKKISFWLITFVLLSYYLNYRVGSYFPNFSTLIVQGQYFYAVITMIAQTTLILSVWNSISLIFKNSFLLKNNLESDVEKTDYLKLVFVETFYLNILVFCVWICYILRIAGQLIFIQPHPNVNGLILSLAIATMIIATYAVNIWLLSKKPKEMVLEYSTNKNLSLVHSLALSGLVWLLVFII